MNLTKRGKLLQDILLRTGPVCSYDLIRIMGTNYPPRAANELDRWLLEHPDEGKLVKDRDCPTHEKCIRYRFLRSSTWHAQPLPLMQAISADPRER